MKWLRLFWCCWNTLLSQLHGNRLIHTSNAHRLELSLIRGRSLHGFLFIALQIRWGQTRYIKKQHHHIAAENKEWKRKRNKNTNNTNIYTQTDFPITSPPPPPLLFHSLYLCSVALLWLLFNALRLDCVMDTHNQ